MSFRGRSPTDRQLDDNNIAISLSLSRSHADFCSLSTLRFPSPFLFTLSDRSVVPFIFRCSCHSLLTREFPWLRYPLGEEPIGFLLAPPISRLVSFCLSPSRSFSFHMAVRFCWSDLSSSHAASSIGPLVGCNYDATRRRIRTTSRPVAFMVALIPRFSRR